MKVYHEEFGEGEIINSTEVVDENGYIVSADIMFEHGIEQNISGSELEEATKGEVRINAASARLKKKTQKEKVGTDETRSNLQWPLHRVKSDSHDKEERVKEVHLIRAKDKHAAVAKVQLSLSRAGHEINSVKHAGMVKEETEELDEKLVGKQDKIDANKNGKIDSDDFKKLKESSEFKTTVTPATAALRIPAVENTVREILNQNRNLRQEAKLEEFKLRNK